MASASLSKDAVKHEAGMLVRLAGPIMLQALFSYSMLVVSTVFVGHLGDPLLMSGVVLGSSFLNVTGWSLLNGLASAMETLCGQAYGAENFHMVGIVLEQAVIILWLVCIPIAMLWWNVEPLLLLLRQPPAIAALSAEYLRSSIPMLPIMALRETLSRYLLAQGVAQPAMITTTITACISPCYSYLLLFRYKLGVQGAVYANIASQSTNVWLLLAYIIYRDWRQWGTQKATWHGLSGRAAFQGWGTYLAYALPSTVMVCLEWWAYEIVIFMAGLTPNARVAVGVMGICFQISTVVYSFCLGFGGAVNTRVANYLGASRPLHAATCFRLGLCFVLTMQSVVCTGVILLRHQISQLFSSSPEVQQLANTVIPFCAFSLVGDAVNCVMASVFRASGRQGLGAGLNLLGFWGLGLPLAAVFGFWLRMGDAGFWIGLGTSTTVMAVLQTGVVLRFDWEKEVQRAAVLVRSVSRQHVGPSDRQPLLSEGSEEAREEGEEGEGGSDGERPGLVVVVGERT